MRDIYESLLINVTNKNITKHPKKLIKLLQQKDNQPLSIQTCHISTLWHKCTRAPWTPSRRRGSSLRAVIQAKLAASCPSAAGLASVLSAVRTEEGLCSLLASRFWQRHYIQAHQWRSGLNFPRNSSMLYCQDYLHLLAWSPVFPARPAHTG